MGYIEDKKQENKIIMNWVRFSLITIATIIIICMVGCPSYNVYSARKDGEAILAHAQSSRDVAVAEAKAKMESASLLAQADTLRAIGIARANLIIGKSLTNQYIHWYWIDNLEKNPNAVIYVPTEANMPIMEANRLKLPTKD